MRLPLPCLVSARPPGKGGRGRRAFTLLEMLVVLIIIAIIAGLALPSIRGTSESAAINAACRQLVADLSYARQRAIAQRSTVAVVFISPDVLDIDLTGGAWTTNEIAEIKRLQGGVYTHYALYQYRKVGEQPGTRETGGYITEWKSLPEKTFLDPDLFGVGNYADGMRYFFKLSDIPKFRFPFSSSAPAKIGTYGLPYVAFDHDGRCIVVERSETGSGSVGPNRFAGVARGAVFFAREPDGSVLSSTFEITQTPPDNATNNVIFIDALTGRARRIETRLQ